MVYCAATLGIRMADNGTLKLDVDNEPQPNISVWIDEKMGGQARIGSDDYLEGAPELIVEVAASSEAYDLHDKRNVYRRNGVREYLVFWLKRCRLIGDKRYQKNLSLNLIYVHRWHSCQIRIRLP